MVSRAACAGGCTTHSLFVRHLPTFVTGSRFGASARHAPSLLENAVPPTLQTVSLRPPRPSVHAHTQPRKRGHRALVEMMGLRLAPLDQVASMRHPGGARTAPRRCAAAPSPSALRSRGTQHAENGSAMAQRASASPSSVEQGIWVDPFYPLLEAASMCGVLQC